MTDPHQRPTRGMDGPRRGFRHGLLVSLTVPGLILAFSSAGFGALALDAGMSLGNAVFMMGIFFALPAQVVMMDQIARGGSVLGGALAVMLTGVRLLPMVVALMPLIRDERRIPWRQVLAVHAVAVTAWIEGMRRLPPLPEEQRLRHFLGIGTGLVLAALIGTAAGYVLAGTVPKIVSAVLLFLTPIYFFLSLLATSREAGDRVAVMAGALIGPVFYVLTPGLDLLLTGLIAGTLGHVAGRRWSGMWREDDDP
ncbi:MAG: AzlC family ABC transporter permease [Hyphomicrobiaceae bacterium]|nr:AzlC family ABC transporter permease [Hyphomicrobiaceae bacterium]